MRYVPAAATDFQDENIYEASHAPKEESDEEYNEMPKHTIRLTRSGRRSRNYAEQDWSDNDNDVDKDEEEEEDTPHVRPRRSTRVSKSLRDFVASDDNDEEDDNADYAETIRARHANERAERARRRQNLMNLATMRNAKRLKRGEGDNDDDDDDDDDDHEDADDGDDDDDDANVHRNTRTRAGRRGKRNKRALSPEALSTGEDSEEHEEDPMPPHRSYSFRARKKVNYSLLPAPPEPLRDGFGRRIRRGSRSASHGSSRAIHRDQDTSNTVSHERSSQVTSLPHSSLPRSMQQHIGWDPMVQMNYANSLVDAMDSSDDEPARASGLQNIPGSNLHASSASALLGNGPAPTTGAVTSSTDTFGRLLREKDTLADVDPLGVNMDVDFTQIGGLGDHVQRLKEMVSLPLLYPEVFQRFGVTPPRGVLFHGPPGTGKTLVARALAASCSTNDQSIHFFMRKGADCLSKWVGEAERQLRLLFEEAKRCQPSIIFFDEIDGLAPVRSSKQDQIHASIVSTLLALMDGMDGRGQVVVIGATNRPDSIDPALRRPGRFDREFYFPLPSHVARRSILDIHTRRWDPPPDDQLKEVLASATNGFGGADLRALCTEATLNAIQRRYPQIYQTNERLLLAPETIQVNGQDFMLALENMVPASARSSGTTCAPLPTHLTPLLGEALSTCKHTFQRLLPKRAKRSALEEAMYEMDAYDAQECSASVLLERELLQQSFVQAQVHRPRLILHGASGLGQRILAEALLHSLEGYHIRTISATLLLGDSSQTPEAVLVHQFQEAKRLVPSVLYVPDVHRWPLMLSESLREVFSALLQEVSFSETIMLLATSEIPFLSLPSDIRAWFGYLPHCKMALAYANIEDRRAYFEDVAIQAARPPTQFSDAMPRRLRQLEELPKAPPRPPRLPTQAELKQMAENDARLLEHLKFRLGSVLAELRKKYKKFTRDVWDEYNLRALMEQFEWFRSKGKITIKLRYDRHSLPASPDSTVAENEPSESNDTAEYNNDATRPSQQPHNPDEACIDSADVQIAIPDAPSETERHYIPVQMGQDATEHTTTSQETQPTSGNVQDMHDDADRFFIRDFTIYTMNLDKMQKRLYQNQYLTCEAFMEDIQKIVSNAEVASEVDRDRVFRAQQMENLAKILLDQIMDPTFRAECKQMENRVLAREEESRREAEKQKEQEVHSRRPNGQRYSARIQGEEPLAEHLIDVSKIERAHKRARSVSHDDIHAPECTTKASNEQLPHNETHDSTSKRTRLEVPASEQGHVNADASACMNALPASYTPSQSQVQRQNSIAVLDEAAKESLVHTLATWTDEFSVEQLELTRAACYERILAHRASWDRTLLVNELENLVKEIYSHIRSHDAEWHVPS